MAKKVSPSSAKADQPGLLNQAGEILSHIVDKISDAKDSVGEFVSTEVVFVKKAAKKIARKVKKAIKKTPAKRAVKRAARKLTKKAAPRKKTVSKSVKKSARKVGSKTRRK